jgi:archaellum biogenesis protein FlaJ (TadC family)
MNMWKILKDLSFKFFKNSLDPFVGFFESIKPDLIKANLELTLTEYVYVMIFSVFLFFAMEFPILTIITSFILNDIVLAIMFSFTLNIVIVLIVFFIFYTYPSMVAGKRKRDIESALPFATTYMATIASSGAPPITMFKVLSQFKEYGEVSREAEKIYNDVEAFGMDLVGSIRKTASRTPSEELKELLWGLDNVLTSGGNIGDFLHEKSRLFISEYRRKLEQYSRTLSLLIEIYLTLVLVGSILFVIITALMSILGGGGMGSYLSFIQFLVIFIVLPFMSTGFIILIRSIAPSA